MYSLLFFYMKKKKSNKDIKLKRFFTAFKNQLKYSNYGYEEYNENTSNPYKFVSSFFYSQFDEEYDEKESKKRIIDIVKNNADGKKRRNAFGWAFINNDDPHNGMITILSIKQKEEREKDNNYYNHSIDLFLLEHIALNLHSEGYNGCIRLCLLAEKYSKGFSLSEPNLEINALYKGYVSDYTFYTSFNPINLMCIDNNNLFSSKNRKLFLGGFTDGNRYIENGIIKLINYQSILNCEDFLKSFIRSFCDIMKLKSFFKDRKPNTNILSSNYYHDTCIGFNKIILLFSELPEKNKTIKEFLDNTILRYKKELNISDEDFKLRFGLCILKKVDRKVRYLKNIEMY